MNIRRRPRENVPVLAICYDFDKTLSPYDMQAQGYIQSLGYEVKEFWEQSNRVAFANEMDSNLSYMYKMVREARGRLIFNRKTLMEYGSRVALFSGVSEWFGRMRDYGKEQGVKVEHYIISSGLKEMIEGTAIAGEFEKIYASSFYYDEAGVAVWPAQVINYTTKTQLLFRIEKGTLDVNDPEVNRWFPESELRVPFRNMVYIGDSETDIPCMKLVNVNGGHAVGVYDPEIGNADRVRQMLRENRIKYFAPADYTPGAPLDTLIKTIIRATREREALESWHDRNAREADISPSGN